MTKLVIIIFIAHLEGIFCAMNTESRRWKLNKIWLSHAEQMAGEWAALITASHIIITILLLLAICWRVWQKIKTWNFASLKWEELNLAVVRNLFLCMWMNCCCRKLSLCVLYLSLRKKMTRSVIINNNWFLYYVCLSETEYMISYHHHTSHSSEFFVTDFRMPKYCTATVQ